MSQLSIYYPYLIAIVLSFGFGIVVHWLIAGRTRAVIHERLTVMTAQVAKLDATEQENITLRTENARLSELSRGEAEKLTWAMEAEQRLNTSFEALASRVLQSSSEQLLSANTEKLSGFATQLQGLVTPLALDVTKMDGFVRELESKREGAYRELSTQLGQLTQHHDDLKMATNNLSGALRSTTIRGQWGEIQLRRVVELAGMKTHVDFSEQVSTEEGRPDMLVRMPNQGVLALDAKTPMSAYLEAMACTDVVEQKKKLKSHADAVYSRVVELGKKQYWGSLDRTPELVVMFIPNEACLSAAFEQSPSLLDDALARKVLIVSPTTLLALLKAVAYGWQQHEISTNAQKIAQEAKEMYKRLMTFADHMKSVGKSLGSTVNAYNNSIGSLQSRLIISVDRLQKLGAGTEQIEFPLPIDISPRELSSSSAGVEIEADIEINTGDFSSLSLAAD